MFLPRRRKARLCQSFPDQAPRVRGDDQLSPVGGLDAWTPDSHPIIGEIREAPGLFCAIGFSGHGFKLGPAVGLLLAEMIVEGRTRTLDLAPLAFEPFSEGRLIRSRYQRYPYVA